MTAINNDEKPYPSEREGDAENRFTRRMRKRPGGGGRPWSREHKASRREPEDRDEERRD